MHKIKCNYEIQCKLIINLRFLFANLMKLQIEI